MGIALLGGLSRPGIGVSMFVHEPITSPRCAPVLLGHRGGRPVDLRGLEQLLLRLSRMACDLPRLAEAELNPVLARPGGVTTLDVRVRLEPCRTRNPHLPRPR
ncbi:acetate--CoA ligase family protein [Streptomyces nondiastaticus]|uniref:Acetate--CoA ligase family protein n=1 Tax=Streptomyces nondiastaticus TaxID=3154512 RepID=A0ABW6U3L7_9ACTN